MITVTDNSDSGAGTLRQAIADAAAGEEIQFAIAGTIDLQSELAIAKNLIITGPGSGTLTIDRDGGAGNLRLVHITAGQVTITGLTFNDGDPGAGNGGAILLETPGELTMSDCVVENSVTNGAGGGVWSNSVAGFTRCTFTNNQSQGGGGAIRNSGILDLTSCIFGTNAGDRNLCFGLGAGGALYSETTATCVDTLFDYNSAATACANVYNTGTMYMLRCRVSFSQSLSLPAILNTNTLALEDVTITNNLGDGLNNNGGSVYLARVTISTHPAFRLGLQNSAGSVYMDTCTVSGNLGTGISNNLGSIDLRHSTITQNGVGFGASAGSDQTFENDIISGNTGASDINVEDVDTTSLGHNIYGVMTNPITLGPGDLSVVGFANLHMGALANNGGSTLTHALLAGSPAINTGNTAGGLPNGGWTFPDPRFQDYTAVPPTYDQRMFPRVDGGVIDIGAFEFVNPPPPPPPPFQQLLSEANCLNCYGLKIEDALELAILTNIVKELDSTMDTSPQALLSQGNCFACLGMDTGSVLKLVLLMLIMNLLSGGAGAPQCILCGSVDPTTDPAPCDCAWYINLTNSTTWYWDDPHNQWYQFG